MDEVAGRVAGEGGAAVLLGQQIAAVDEDAARRGEAAFVQRRRRPVLAERIDLAAGVERAVVQLGDVLDDRRARPGTDCA